MADGRQFHLNQGSRTLTHVWPKYANARPKDRQEDEQPSPPISVTHDGISTTFYADRDYVYMSGDDNEVNEVLSGSCCCCF